MTKGEIDKLGQRIGASKTVSNEDLEMLQAYRQTFQEPISRVFNFVLNAARRIDKQCIVTYRIKRIDTIIGKMRRFQGNEHGRMSLSRMWDIAGCRCILNIPDTNKIYQLKEMILKEFGQDCKINDHINPPKASGYRSLHVYVKDKLTQKPIEIQIRNREMHNWATLVEIVDLLYDAKNKEQGASGKLGRFLYLYSHAATLQEADFSEMLQMERQMKVFEKMSDVLTRNYLNIRLQWLKEKAQGAYFVITANKSRSEIQSYQGFREAEAAYYEKYLANSDSNIVLTHIKDPDFNKISMAYSNYVLAMHAFLDDYRVLVSKKIIDCMINGDYPQFFKDFQIYNDNLSSHFKNLNMEIRLINDCSSDPSISRNQLNKWRNEIKDRLAMWQRESLDFIRILTLAARGSRLKKWMVRNRVAMMGRAIRRGQKKK